MIHDTGNCKTNQLHSVSGIISGLQVRVLRGPPIIKDSDDRAAWNAVPKFRGGPSSSVLTDETGHFTFAKVANGMYDVRAQGNGLWSDLYRNVSVKKNDEVSVKLQLKVAPPKPAKP
jgi:hypothetical protein